MIEEVERAIEKYFSNNNEVFLTGMPVLAHTMQKLLVKVRKMIIEISEIILENRTKCKKNFSCLSCKKVI